MKIKKLIVGIICSFLFAAGSSFVFAADFKIMTEEYPPYNYTEDGKLTGLSSEVMVELTKRLGHSGDIEVLSWARAYGLIQKKDGLILYSMTRTE